MTDAAVPAATRRRRAAHARGLAAEERAATLLGAHGFEIVARRVRTKAGEIDLIARQGDLLVFCEVKLRADLSDAAFSLLPRQRRRIAAAAEAFLADHPELSRLNMRFDAVLLARSGAAEHLPGAFEAEV
ncbi:YraN family protein [Xanthobacter autotrophicus]|uniref:YraN family protein n=1 Tax=Xanthobacter autotrophicus TaxID=280 RepID=UPI0024A74DBC|nr:YraN family protein [Xanthobacter autotrophicus]MDI4656581.1 YraN family protein [Xanthobacter autotrophicus]